ncbi:hypothetical protein T4B_7257, partial [Trichinella pseudospiralis]
MCMKSKSKEFQRSLYNYSLKTNGRTSSPGNLLFIFQASLQQIHYYIANIILKNEASIEEFFGSLFFYHINMTLRLVVPFNAVSTG